MAKRLANRKKIEGGFDGFFEEGYAKGWVFKVPEAFADQLDIAQTTKGATQGNCFSFEEGDVFYDSASAYSETWAETAKKTKCAIIIEDALGSSIITEEETDDSGKTKKKKYVIDGSLKFSLFRTCSDGALDFSKPEPFETNQFEFAGFLQTGVLNDGKSVVLSIS